jgi:hypothetical protein
MHNAAGCFGSRSLATKSRHSSLIYLVVLQARETYLDKYKGLEPEIKELDEEVKKFRDNRAEANTPALGSRPRARVFVAIYSTIKFAFGVIIAAHPAQPQLLTSSRASLICVSFSFSYLSFTSTPVPLSLPLLLSLSQLQRDGKKRKRSRTSVMHWTRR